MSFNFHKYREFFIVTSFIIAMMLICMKAQAQNSQLNYQSLLQKVQDACQKDDSVILKEECGAESFGSILVPSEDCYQMNHCLQPSRQRLLQEYSHYCTQAFNEEYLQGDCNKALSLSIDKQMMSIFAQNMDTGETANLAYSFLKGKKVHLILGRGNGLIPMEWFVWVWIIGFPFALWWLWGLWKNKDSYIGVISCFLIITTQLYIIKKELLLLRRAMMIQRSKNLLRPLN